MVRKTFVKRKVAQSPPGNQCWKSDGFALCLKYCQYLLFSFLTTFSHLCFSPTPLLSFPHREKTSPRVARVFCQRRAPRRLQHCYYGFITVLSLLCFSLTPLLGFCIVRISPWGRVFGRVFASRGRTAQSSADLSGQSAEAACASGRSLG